MPLTRNRPIVITCIMTIVRAVSQHRLFLGSAADEDISVTVIMQLGCGHLNVIPCISRDWLTHPAWYSYKLYPCLRAWSTQTATASTHTSGCSPTLTAARCGWRMPDLCGRHSALPQCSCRHLRATDWTTKTCRYRWAASSGVLWCLNQYTFGSGRLGHSIRSSHLRWSLLRVMLSHYPSSRMAGLPSAWNQPFYVYTYHYVSCKASPALKHTSFLLVMPSVLTDNAFSLHPPLQVPEAVLCDAHVWR